jgi:hypothetical protein
MPDPLYSRDYVRSAQITGLAYLAKQIQNINFTPGLTGEALAVQIRRLSTYREIFSSDTEVDQFAAQYSFVRAKGTGDQSVGPDVVAFRALSNNAIQLGVAGVNYKFGELPQTVSYTNGVGFNDRAYAPVRDFYLGLVQDYPGSTYDFMGHSLGGQSIQILAAENSLRGLNARIETITTCLWN